MEEPVSTSKVYKRSFVIQPAKKSYVYYAIIVGIVILTICVIIGFYITIDKQPAPATPLPLPATPTLTQPQMWKSYTVPAAHLTFSAPPEMEVVSETQPTDDGKISSITLYIQKGTAGQADYYQLYGLYRLEGEFTKNSLIELKSELDPALTEDTYVAGFPAVEGQITGERNRYVTYILTDRGMFSLFTSQPTPENHQLTDEILSTFDFTN